MVQCPSCTVDTADRYCTRDAKLCYNCCTAKDNSCPPHFRMLPVAAQIARLRADMPQGNADAQPEEQKQPQPTVQQQPAPGQPGEGEAPLAGAAPPEEQRVAPIAPSATDAAITELARALAALRAEMQADRAASDTAQRALTAQLNKQTATNDKLVAALAASMDRAHSAPPLAAGDSFPTQPRPTSSPTQSPPHRAAKLDRAASAISLTNEFEALADDDSNADDREVTTRTLLPAAFVPTPAGSEQSSAQQLAAILAGIHKQGKVKYTDINDFNERLDDWVDAYIADGRPAAHVDSVRRYQRLLIQQLHFSEHWSFKEVLEYHRLWCKKYAAYSPDTIESITGLDHNIYHAVKHPLQLGGHAAATPSPSRKPAAARPASTAASGTAAGSSSLIGRHPAGSCTNHPTSTTHTTAECQKKK